MSSGKVLLGVLAGAAIGATLGILFAPDKGSATRKSVSEKAEEYADALKEKFDRMVDSIGKKYESNRQGADDLVSKGKIKYDEVKKEAKNAVSEIKHAVS